MDIQNVWSTPLWGLACKIKQKALINLNILHSHCTKTNKMREKYSHGDYCLCLLPWSTRLKAGSLGLCAKSRAPNLYFTEELNYVILCSYWASTWPLWSLTLLSVSVKCYTEVRRTPNEPTNKTVIIIWPY